MEREVGIVRKMNFMLLLSDPFLSLGWMMCVSMREG
jgi:hypothetical protein